MTTGKGPAAHERAHARAHTESHPTPSASVTQKLLL